MGSEMCIRDRKSPYHGPEQDTVDDNHQLPQKDSQEDHLEFRIRVRVIRSPEDEVDSGGGPGKGEDAKGDGDPLSKTDSTG